MVELERRAAAPLRAGKVHPQSWITDGTFQNIVLLIFKQLMLISGRIDALKESFVVFTKSYQDGLTRKEGGDACPDNECTANSRPNKKSMPTQRKIPTQQERKAGIEPKSKSSRSLQNNQIALLIVQNEVNKGRWGSKKAVIWSLSEILRCPPQLIDLTETVWLPSGYECKRVLLTFKQTTIPSMLFKMKQYLGSFQIFTKKVFKEERCVPLWVSPHQDTATIARKLGVVDKPAGNAGAANAADVDERKLPAEILEGNLREAFGLLPSLEQENVLQRLEDLRSALLATQKTAAPLINLVSLPEEDDLNNGSLMDSPV